MNRNTLIQQIFSKRTFLCVGLDTDRKKIPAHLLSESDPVLAFNKAIIAATAPYCVAYKINTAFYEADGATGWETMQHTLEAIPDTHFTIADAKRGDIGNTSQMYARAFFETLSFDSITLAPYMGKDSIDCFFSYPDKWGIVLALTSNSGSQDYEQQYIGNERLYERVIRYTSGFSNPENAMFVVGATKAQAFIEIRNQIPHHFLLVPGVGAQGGSLAEVAQYGMNADVGLLVNASRSILYASPDIDFAEAAAKEAQQMAKEMDNLIRMYTKK